MTRSITREREEKRVLYQGIGAASASWNVRHGVAERSAAQTMPRRVAASRKVDAWPSGQLSDSVHHTRQPSAATLSRTG